MNESTDWNATVRPTQPRSSKKRVELLKKIQSLSKADLQQVLSVSDSLTELNFKRYQDWDQLIEKPAILLYDGDIYKMLNQTSWNKSQQQYAQQHFRIISGLYGLLRPYDVIKPYRLEMKTSLDWLDQSLANWWSDEISKQLNHDIAATDAEAVINLASQEYAKAVNLKQLSVPVIDVAFKEKKNGKLRTVAIYAKKARGMMIEWLIQNQVKNVTELDQFDLEGYSLHSTNATTKVFVR